ncbi:MAG: hypothetical protein K9L85_03335 [Candidatus Peribacteraceae bacterium]|nr:hypothetical protein [Candidatus Peribacteraceae bacterium]
MPRLSKKFGFRLSPHFAPTLITAIGVVMVWRGVWFLLDLYLLPDKPTLSGITSLIIGLAILYLPNGKIDDLF